MKELIEYIVKSLVIDEESVKVTVEGENEITVNVTVNPDDLGRVIGKNGRTAAAIRSIAKTIANKDHKKVFVKFGE